MSEEHARKTITVDPFPHTAVRAASIHPCKHAAVMQKLGALAESGGKPFQVERHAPQTLPQPLLDSTCVGAFPGSSGKPLQVERRACKPCCKPCSFLQLPVCPCKPCRYYCP